MVVEDLSYGYPLLPPGYPWTGSLPVEPVEPARAVASFPGSVWRVLQWWLQGLGLARPRLLNLGWIPSECRGLTETTFSNMNLRMSSPQMAPN